MFVNKLDRTGANFLPLRADDHRPSGRDAGRSHLPIGAEPISRAWSIWSKIARSSGRMRISAPNSTSYEEIPADLADKAPNIAEKLIEPPSNRTTRRWKPRIWKAMSRTSRR